MLVYILLISVTIHGTNDTKIQSLDFSSTIYYMLQPKLLRALMNGGKGLPLWASTTSVSMKQISFLGSCAETAGNCVVHT